MASLQEGTFTQLKNGPVKITFDSLELGFTREGVDVEVINEWEDVTVDEGGETPLDAMRSAEGIEVTCRLPQFSVDLLAKIMAGNTNVTDGSKRKVTMGQAAGYRARDYAGALRLHPALLASNDLTQDVLVYLAYVHEGPAFSYNFAELTMYEVTFRGLLDTDRAQGDQIYSIGDDTASADTTPPTLTIVPADAATGVVVTSNIVWTASEALDPNYVTDEEFTITKDSDGTDVPGVVTYDSGALTVTFNPTSSLEAATAYTAVASRAVRDVNGNKLAARKITNFTTA